MAIGGISGEKWELKDWEDRDRFKRGGGGGD